jgi:hypothetical protein
MVKSNQTDRQMMTVLESQNWRVGPTAALLGMSEHTLRYRLVKGAMYPESSKKWNKNKKVGRPRKT